MEGNDLHIVLNTVRDVSFATICFALLALKYDFKGTTRAIKILVLSLGVLVLAGSAWVLFKNFSGLTAVYPPNKYGALSRGGMWPIILLMILALMYPKSKFKK